MRRFFSGGISLLIVSVVCISLPAEAQDKPAGATKASSVCVGLDSNYARINAFLPSLAKYLQKELPKQRKQVHIAWASVNPRNAAESAEAKGCEYLLQLSLEETNGARVGFDVGTFTPGTPGGPSSTTRESEQDLQQLAVLEIKYRLQSLNGTELDVKDSEYVHQLDYPSVWDAAAFETAVDRATARVAVASLKNLPQN